MRNPDKKEQKQNQNPRANRTGEDIDMLHENDYEPESSDSSGSNSYKDNYDGA